MKTFLRLLALIALIALALPLSAETVAVGRRVLLVGSSDGDDPRTWEWFKNGTKIADGTTLTIEAAAKTDAGSYVLRVTNAAGSAESPPVVLEVISPPTAPRINVTLANMEVRRNSELRLAIVAEGAEPMTYQWQHGNAIVRGETKPFVLIPRVQNKDAGFWAVVARNKHGGATSDMVLTVKN